MTEQTSAAVGVNVTPEMVEAARAILADYVDLGGYARVSDYVHDGQNEDERAAGIAAMKAEDARLDDEVRRVVRDAIIAAMAASGTGD